jgi:hypothetical protein
MDGAKGWFGILLALLTSIALGLGSAPLPDLPAVPDGSEVKIVSLSGSVYASGVVRTRVLTLTTQAGARRLPAGERVQLWIGIPSATDINNRDLTGVAGQVNPAGTDVLIGDGKDRQTLTQILRDAYGIRLELR